MGASPGGQFYGVDVPPDRPLLGESGHGAELSVCPLMTQSGHSAQGSQHGTSGKSQGSRPTPPPLRPPAGG